MVTAWVGRPVAGGCCFALWQPSVLGVGGVVVGTGVEVNGVDAQWILARVCAALAAAYRFPPPCRLKFPVS